MMLKLYSEVGILMIIQWFYDATFLLDITLWDCLLVTTWRKQSLLIGLKAKPDGLY